MRIEPRVLDGNIEKKSLREKKPVQDMDSYESLFIDDDALQRLDTLSKLEVIDDEDRQATFNARNIGQALVPNMDTKEVKNAVLMQSLEKAGKALYELIPPERLPVVMKASQDLEAAIEGDF